MGSPGRAVDGLGLGRGDCAARTNAKNAGVLRWCIRRTCHPFFAITGGVDIANQLCNNYDIQLTSPRIWWSTLPWPSDTTIKNAFQGIPQASKASTHKEFRLQCAWGLVLTGHSLLSPQGLVQKLKRTPDYPRPKTCPSREAERKNTNRETKAVNKINLACSKCDRPLFPSNN